MKNRTNVKGSWLEAILPDQDHNRVHFEPAAIDFTHVADTISVSRFADMSNKKKSTS